MATSKISSLGPHVTKDEINTGLKPACRKEVSTDVPDASTDLLILSGPPEYIRPDNGPEFADQKVRDRIAAVGAKTAHIDPGSPWENGYCESINARFRDEFLNGETFYRFR